jgi:hypothetical protein
MTGVRILNRICGKYSYGVNTESFEFLNHCHISSHEPLYGDSSSSMKAKPLDEGIDHTLV